MKPSRLNGDKNEYLFIDWTGIKLIYRNNLSAANTKLNHSSITCIKIRLNSIILRFEMTKW